MTVHAFMYNTYYCWGIRQNYRGVYKDIDEALNSLHGDRYENQNLELFNDQTGEWGRYKWKPTYELEWTGSAHSIQDGDANCITKSKRAVKLTLVYKSGVPEALHVIETNEWELNRGNGKHYNLERSGRWEVYSDG